MNMIKKTVMWAAAALLLPVAQAWAAPVAKVGDTEYDTIDAAVAAWSANTTLTLLDDVEITKPIVVENVQKLDLGSATLTAIGCCAVKLEGTGNCNLTITANATNPGRIVASEGAVYAFYNDCKYKKVLTIENGIFDGVLWLNKNKQTIAGNGTSGEKGTPLVVNLKGGIYNGAIYEYRCYYFTIEGGTYNQMISLQSTSTCKAHIYYGRYKSFPTNWSGENRVIVADQNDYDTIKKVEYFYVDADGYYVLTNKSLPSEYEATGDGYRHKKASNAIKMANNVVLCSGVGTSEEKVASEAFSVNASAEDAVYGGNVTLAHESATFTAIGTFTGKVLTTVVGKVVKITDNGTSKVYSVADPIAKIGDVGYTTLSNAVEMVQNGETITLLADNAEVFAAETTALFAINTNGFAFTAANVTPKEGCELVQNLDGTYSYRMQVEVNDQITKNVVETKTESETSSAAVTITDDNFKKIFSESGSKTLEVKAAGVGTVSFDSKAVDKIGQNITNVITQAGGAEESATTKTTLTVAIADVTEEVKEEKPMVIIVEKEVHEVVQVISVTAIMQSIVQQAGSTAAVTNEEVFASGKAAGNALVKIPYSGINPQVWYVDTTEEQWTTNPVDTAYNADTKILSFKVKHFSEYPITDAEVLAKVGDEKFATLQGAFDWVATNQTQGTTVTLTKTNTLTGVATLAKGSATLDLNGYAVLGSISAADGAILTVGNGTINAGTGEFATGEGTAKIYITDGTYFGAFPTAGAVTNAGPLLVSGGKFKQVVPWAFCAPGYEPNTTPDADGFYTVKNAKIFIRDIGACHRYPWSGYVDITVDVCWDTYSKAKLYVMAWDKSDGKQIEMKAATLIEENVPGERSVDCEKGFVVVAPTKKTLHLIWNSAGEGVPRGSKRESVGFSFLAKETK